jgi:hypothetical protein
MVCSQKSVEEILYRRKVLLFLVFMMDGERMIEREKSFQ